MSAEYNLDDLDEVVEVNESTGEITLEYDYHYKGKLGIYFETGLGPSLILQDVRGIKKSGQCDIKWAVFIKGNEYIKILDNKEGVVWEGWLVEDMEKMMVNDHDYFIPLDVDEDTWQEWFLNKCWAEVYTNCPVLAEDSVNEYIN